MTQSSSETIQVPDTMLAIQIESPGGPEMLVSCERPVPTPKAHEVLIKVAAAGVNRPDVLQRQGFYPPPEGASDLPGLEVSGTIVAMGSDTSSYKIGDQVCALLPGGGYAQYAVADERLCMAIPPSLSLEDAAGLPETCITVWANIFDDAGLKPGETLLVHGGTSGIGTTAISMAKAFDVTTVTTAGTEEKCAALRDFGADHVFQYNKDKWETLINADPINGVDVVLDMTGGDFVARNLTCLRPGGRHVSIAFLRGMTAEINIMAIMRNRLRISGSTLRARSPQEKARLARAVEDNVWPKFANNEPGTSVMRAHTCKTFPLSQAAAAHQMMQDGTHLGKILLIP